jgi:predicted TIM-barrel fold metal-dependent hydrolase
VDSYGHVSLPRFVSVEEYLSVMDAHAIEKAIVCTAETCPDLPELSRALVHHADRLRVVGVPLGRTYTEICESIQHQADCGFIGLRIQAKMIAEFPELLQLFGKRRLIPWVVGENGLQIAAGHLLEYLAENNSHYVIAPHFANTTNLAVFTTPGQLQQLFRHPRFLVVFSRQGAYEPAAVRSWALRLIEELGWQRILYGSEFPVCLWRNESYQDTVNWIQTLGLSPTETELSDYYGGTALRLLWESPPRPVHLADEKWSAKNWAVPGKVNLLANHPLEIPEEIHHRLLARYLLNDMQSQFQDYRDYLTWIFLVGCEKAFQEDHPIV